ncbi:glycosyltransferase [Accumulibacter sp.]|uniref:glycosyltransferase n=1 Tax=Accumulibacter sp. TaxID=2053492 RepID=UPI0026160773|nr:glycosyltransferase [Accumulibacter sp.]
MNILHFISCPASGGAEVYVKDLSKELSRVGHRVYVGFLERAADVGRNLEYERAFLAELESEGITYFFAGNECRKKPWLGVSRVRDFARKHGVEVYHSHLPYGVVFSALLRIPCIYTHHSSEPRISQWIFRAFNFRVHTYVGISTLCASRLHSYTRKPVVTITNAVDPVKLHQISTDSFNRKKLRGIAVGRITPQKNYFLLVDAISRLTRELRENFVVYIAGEGPAEHVDSLVKYIQALGLTENLMLLGNCTHIADELAKSDVFLMSSAWEGVPIALIEAGLSGLPCVVTDVGGCREVIEVLRNGIVVPPDDPDAFSNGLGLLLGDSMRRREFSNNALANSYEFTIHRACVQHVSVYEKAVRS